MGWTANFFVFVPLLSRPRTRTRTRTGMLLGSSGKDKEELLISKDKDKLLINRDVG